ncbi:MAG: glycoside hydrolase family 3 N-terminal domain-containing protein [Candidatus Sericytochromatia bacterium]
MELEKKIAQSICIEVRMPELDSEEKINEIKENLKKYQWGSIILFDGEIESCHKLINELQEISDIPLFVCADLEKGAGQHFKGATDIPSNMAIGATDNYDLAYKAGKITAQEAKEIGLNVIFSPSIDVNNNHDNPIINIRSFGEIPQDVADFGQAFISGVMAENVIATPKHFPGHGDTSIDSHVSTPIIKKSKSELNKTELLPFKQIIDKTDALMTAHIIVTSLDKKYPATISKEIITGLLRNTYKFDGLIFTDALMMGGITEEKSYESMAYIAGCDILLMPPNPIKALNDIVELVNKGEISLEHIDAIYNRILKYKERYIDKSFKSNLKRIKTERNITIAKSIAQNAVTKIKQKDKLVFDPLKTVHIILDQDDEPEKYNTLKNLMSEKGIETIIINSEISEPELEIIENKINDKDNVILSYFSFLKAWKKHIYPENFVISWLESYLLNNKKVFVVAFSNPYLMKKVNGIKNYFCTFSDSEYSQEAITKVLFDNVPATGISPIDLSS